MKYIKIERMGLSGPHSQIYVFLDYDVNVSKFIQFHIFSKHLANYSLFGELRDENKTQREHRIDRRGAIKLPMYRNYRMLLIEEPSKELLLPFDF